MIIIGLTTDWAGLPLDSNRYMTNEAYGRSERTKVSLKTVDNGTLFRPSMTWADDLLIDDYYLWNVQSWKLIPLNSFLKTSHVYG